jgi:hypothetical protein
MQEDMGGGSLDAEHREERPFEQGPANPASTGESHSLEERRLRQLCHENEHLRQVKALLSHYAGAVKALLGCD